MDSDNVSSSSSGIVDVTEFSSNLLKAVSSAVKASSSLPHSGDDFDLYSSFSGFRKFYSSQASRLTDQLNIFLKHQGMRLLPNKESELNDVDDKYDRIVEANDMMLEQISALLEKASDPKKNVVDPDALLPFENAAQRIPKTVVSSWNRNKKHGKNQMFRLFHAQNISRPQTKFKDKIDNANVPFVPKIKEKPNALKPLSKALINLNSQPQDENISLAITHLIRQSREYSADDQNIYAHPYQCELDGLQYGLEQLQEDEPQKFSPFPPEACQVLTAKMDLLDVIDHLKTCKEFAVDLEAHSYRSFQGLTCLMQISSRTRDFLIDTLALRSEIYRLNEVFTDPEIVKVFHGADFDIQWLQRDFGVYVVNMFDTGQAARELGLGRFSLDFLLQKYCDVHADKKYQLADWRIRPIPEEMRKYAQEDTHYLLYIYDVMKNELVAAANTGAPKESRLLKVLGKSRDICMKLYEKPLINAESHLKLYEKWRSKKRLNEKQLELFRLIFVWRDAMARQEDESTGYVLPKHMLYQIAEIMPREAQGILACCNPIPPLVHQHVHSLHQLVVEARAKSITKKKGDLSSENVPIKTPVPAKPEIHEYDDLLSCPHDRSHVHMSKGGKHKFLIQTVPEMEWSTFLGDVSFPPPLAATKKLGKTHWDPYAKYFDPATSYTEPVKLITTREDLNVRTMLSPEYGWKLKKLETAEEPKKKKTKTEIKQPDTKDEVIILSKLPQLQGQQRPSQPLAEEKKMSKHAKKKARKDATNFRPFQYQASHYDRFRK